MILPERFSGSAIAPDHAPEGAAGQAAPELATAPRRVSPGSRSAVGVRARWSRGAPLHARPRRMGRGWKPGFLDGPAMVPPNMRDLVERVMPEWFWPSHSAPNTIFVRIARVLHWMGYAAAIWALVVATGALIEIHSLGCMVREEAQMVLAACAMAFVFGSGGRAARYIIASE